MTKSNVTELVPAAIANRETSGAATPSAGTPPSTAAIIAFPARTKPAPAAPAQVTPEVRLARALKSLSVALAEQRVVLTAWRDALGDLKTTTAGLNDSLSRYRDNLQSLGDNVSALKEKAQALETFADKMIPHEG